MSLPGQGIHGGVRGKIPPEACAELLRKCSHHSFPHLGTVISKDHSCVWYSQAESGSMSNTHIYLHIFTRGSRDTPWLVDETISLEFLQEKCLISMENTHFQWRRSCLFLSAREKVKKFWGSLVSPSPGDTLGLFCCVLHGYQTPDVFSPRCGFRVRLQAGLRAHTKALWSVNNIPLFHRCAGIMHLKYRPKEPKLHFPEVKKSGSEDSVSAEIKEFGHWFYRKRLWS